jgi:ABC-type Fe3+/spermidine/putrescine transport system ATPase subunit
MTDAHLVLDRVTVRRKGQEPPILAEIGFTLPPGRTLALIGPEGAGKTATLLTIAGFLRPALGTLRLAGRDITATPPERRDTAMLAEQDALFPHLSVRDNVAFGLKMRSMPRTERRAAADTCLARLGVGALAQRHPARLDPEERRLVALARAVACRPALLLVDEPEGDEAVLAALRPLLRGEHPTAILATHDRAAAFGLADIVALLRAGQIEQLGPPRALFERPASRFAANFAGPCNLLPATLLGHTAAGALLKLSAGTANAQARPELPAGRVLLCLRPHRLRLDPTGSLRGPVEAIDYQGTLTRITLRAPEGTVIADLAQAPPGLAPGDPLALGWEPENAWLLPADA